ncbi:MAG: hypothetical protein ACI351_05890 [Candidatus Avelusimicrobium sp.]|uniref:hypothetical protein n=1 Tax=Candidatus Avelusimicrobium sp. TaxID=3048833 RepID=UPI003EFE7425
MDPAKAKEWLVLAGIVGGVIMWFATMYGLPPRVDRLEEKVASHERILTEYGVKIDIVLDDVKTIKSLLLNRQGDK